MHDKRQREERFAKKLQDLEKRKYGSFFYESTKYRTEQLERDNERWKRMDEEEKKEAARVEKLRESNKVGKRNLSSAAYNPITLEYDPTEEGRKLRQVDQMAVYRAQLRSHNIDSRSNSGYNILTGETRRGVVVAKPDFLQEEASKKAEDTKKASGISN